MVDLGTKSPNLITWANFKLLVIKCVDSSLVIHVVHFVKGMDKLACSQQSLLAWSPSKDWLEDSGTWSAYEKGGKIMTIMWQLSSFYGP